MTRLLLLCAMRTTSFVRTVMMRYNWSSPDYFILSSTLDTIDYNWVEWLNKWSEKKHSIYTSIITLAWCQILYKFIHTGTILMPIFGIDLFMFSGNKFAFCLYVSHNVLQWHKLKNKEDSKFYCNEPVQIKFSGEY